MANALKPRRGGMLKPFGCGWFIREFLLGHRPYDFPQNPQPMIHPEVGAPQADIFYWYKMALLRVTAEDRAARAEERQARWENRRIDPGKIEELIIKYLARSPYKVTSCRYHSFVVYFSTLRRLEWVEFTGQEEPSAFQDHYTPGPPRRYFRLTLAGKSAADIAWANPQLTLYG